ncbi:hypothetical protein BaRGS_00022507 [Batillaria attramentaria]|uniref:Uncharacterized protein n=1 Tax=Batillaria attramentaria TaxID=370345 RepID=A0ABD0KG99_9CAEN
MTSGVRESKKKKTNPKKRRASAARLARRGDTSEYNLSQLIQSYSTFSFSARNPQMKKHDAHDKKQVHCISGFWRKINISLTGLGIALSLSHPIMFHASPYDTESGANPTGMMGGLGH